MSATPALPPLRDGRYRARIGDRAYDVEIRDGEVLVDGEPVDVALAAGSAGSTLLMDGRASWGVVQADGARHHVTLDGHSFDVQVQDERALLLEQYGLADEAASAEREVRAPMPGLVLHVLVEAGQKVEEGDGLLVLEAMKMENELRAATAGTIAAVHVTPGEAVAKNALLIEVEG